MTEDRNPLDGLDRPRPLTREQRGRLEQALLADDLATRLAEAAGPRPLRPDLRASLLAQLARRPRWRDPAALGGAAAAVAAVVAAVLLAGPGEGPAGTSTALPPSPAVVDSGTGTADGVSAPVTVGGGVRPTPTSGHFAKPRGTASRAAADGSGTVQPGTAGPAAGAPSPRPAALAVPLVRSLSPASGPLTGGNVVVVRGERLSADPEVWFGTVRASSVEVRSDGELRVVAPAHLPGEVEVVVRTAAGSSAPGPGSRYRYAA